MNRVSEDMINIILKQMGATSIKSVPSYVNIVKFEVTPKLKLSYVYHINEDDGIYLQRMAPYPMRIGKLYGEQDVIDFIERDIKRFEAAYNSNNFSKFITLTNELAALDRRIENIFMMKNVDRDDLERVEREVAILESLMREIDEKSPLLD